MKRTVRSLIMEERSEVAGSQEWGPEDGALGVMVLQACVYLFVQRRCTLSVFVLLQLIQLRFRLLHITAFICANPCFRLIWEDVKSYSTSPLSIYLKVIDIL